MRSSASLVHFGQVQQFSKRAKAKDAFDAVCATSNAALLKISASKQDTSDANSMFLVADDTDSQQHGTILGTLGRALNTHIANQTALLPDLQSLRRNMLDVIADGLSDGDQFKRQFAYRTLESIETHQLP